MNYPLKEEKFYPEIPKWHKKERRENNIIICIGISIGIIMSSLFMWFVFNLFGGKWLTIKDQEGIRQHFSPDMKVLWTMLGAWIVAGIVWLSSVIEKRKNRSK